jgi:hypothetical protein
MQYKFLITGPFVLTSIDNEDANYLKLKFDDGCERKLSKGGSWPPEYAQNLLGKALALKDQSVYIKTSQTTKNWDSKEWMCDIHAQALAEKRTQLAVDLKPKAAIEKNDSAEKFILVSTANGKSYFANIEPIVNYFNSENDLLDFSNSFEKDFVSAWSAKNARLKGLPNGTKRIRIGGFGNRTKRNGFRVVVAEVATDETSEAFKFFHVLRLDEKAEKEDYLTDSELKEVTLLQSELEEKYPKSYLTWA